MKKQKNIGIIGLGYVGLPLAVVFAEAGYNVIGFDLQSSVCKKLNSGFSHIKDIPNSKILNLIKIKLFFATTEFQKLAECDLISICVPTPLNKISDPDLSYVISATENISKFLKKNQLIILESTTYPGTTKEIVLPILEKKGLKVGEDFNLCYSPERVDPGNKIWGTKNTPKILGGVTQNCLKAGKNIYNKVFDKIIEVENTDAAELVKVYENTFRLINIALANELSQICDKLNLNVWNIIDAAATKPFGFMKFTPGPGLGGHCIPLDPRYLSWKMRTLSFKTKLIDIASEINSEMPNYIVEKAGKKLNQLGKAFKNSKILIVGIAYKKNINDIRESPAIEIIKLLEDRGSNISYHDPYCDKIIDDGHTPILNLPKYSVELTKNELKSKDLVIIVTDHSNINYDMIFNNSINTIDTRGVYNKRLKNV
jgi:UDP-N-acetyl-D-glucosamine dehydrogenase